jgi:predicted MFS family arabinose efflux permease
MTPVHLSGLRSKHRNEKLVLLQGLVSSIGFGLYSSVNVIYFSRYGGITATQAGIGISVSSILWLPAAVFVGRLVDALGARRCAATVLFVLGLVLLTGPSIHGFPLYMVFVCVTGVLNSTSWTASGAILARLFASQDRVGLSAWSRSVANVGLALGAAVSGAALTVGSRGAIACLLYGYGMSILATGAIVLLLPPDPPRSPRRGDTGRRAHMAVRDLPFIATSLWCGAVAVYDAALAIGVPLWVVTYTSAPRGLGGWLLIINTGMVVLFQVRASRGVTGLASARRVAIRGCVMVAAACGVFSVTRAVTVWLAVVLLVIGVVLLSLGELWSAVAQWTFRFDLADPRRQADYGAAFSMGTTLATVVGPIMVTSLLQASGGFGWGIMAAYFIALSLVSGLILRWAEERSAGQRNTEPAPASHSTEDHRESARHL